jgi:hypothetical protein
MLEEAVTKARRLVAELERDAADMHRPSSLPDAEHAQAKQAIETALASARRLLESLQKAAESEKLR